MNPTARTSRTSITRVAAFVAAAAASTLAVLPPNLAPATAHEPLPATTSSPTPPYAIPLAALGGRTLAVYVTEHQLRFLGPTVG